VSFLAVFYAVWPIQFAAFMVPTIPSNYWIYFLAAIFGPLQGFLNALIVFCRDRRSINRRASQNMNRVLSRVSTRQSKNIGSSEVDSVALACGKAAKHAADCSGKREEADQAEMSVRQIDRLELEEQAPEANLNGEGEVLDEVLDESDDCLLEHAMNAGLLNDDDCEVFRQNIARIESRKLVHGDSTRWKPTI
jgi:hypothetical protein